METNQLYIRQEQQFEICIFLITFSEIEIPHQFFYFQVTGVYPQLRISAGREMGHLRDDAVILIFQCQIDQCFLDASLIQEITHERQHITVAFMIGGVCLLSELDTIIRRIRNQHEATVPFPYIGGVARQTLCRVAFHLSFRGTKVKRLLTQAILNVMTDIHEFVCTRIIIDKRRVELRPGHTMLLQNRIKKQVTPIVFCADFLFRDRGHTL